MSQFGTLCIKGLRMPNFQGTIFRCSHRRCSLKKVFLKFRKIHRKTSVPESLFKTVAGLRSFFIKKGHLAEVFSCEFCEIFKNTFFHKTPTVAVSYDHAHIGRFPNLHSSTFKLQNHLKV